jgi:hypothetical protein
MKKIIFPILFLLASCSSPNNSDYESTQKSSSASSRIDNVQSGSNKILKDLND